MVLSFVREVYFFFFARFFYFCLASLFHFSSDVIKSLLIPLAGIEIVATTFRRTFLRDLLSFSLFVGCQLCWKDHFDFSCHAVCTYVCIHVLLVYVSCSSTKKVNIRFSNENALTDFRKTWYVDSSGN